MLSVWAVKSAVKTLLAERPGLAGVLVMTGLPADEIARKQPDRVYILDQPTPAPRKPVWASGNIPREEELAIPIIVEVAHYSGDRNTGHDEAMARAGVIANEIDQQTLDDPEWGGVCVNSGISLQREATPPLPDGWISRAWLTLHIKTRGS